MYTLGEPRNSEEHVKVTVNLPLPQICIMACFLIMIGKNKWDNKKACV